MLRLSYLAAVFLHISAGMHIETWYAKFETDHMVISDRNSVIKWQVLNFSSLLPQPATPGLVAYVSAINLYVGLFEKVCLIVWYRPQFWTDSNQIWSHNAPWHGTPVYCFWWPWLEGQGHLTRKCIFCLSVNSLQVAILHESTPNSVKKCTLGGQISL